MCLKSDSAPLKGKCIIIRFDEPLENPEEVLKKASVENPREYEPKGEKYGSRIERKSGKNQLL